MCEYSRSRSFHDDLILQDQASGERSQDQWSSGTISIAATAFWTHNVKKCLLLGGELALNLINSDPYILPEHTLELVVSNSECLPDVAMKAFIKYITNNTIPITAVLGRFYDTSHSS